MYNNNSSRSWFCVLNNPEKMFGSIDPETMVKKALDIWMNEHPFRTCGANYEIGDNGTPHMHLVLEDSNKTRFKYVQNLYKGIHIEPTKGSKKDAEDYLYKRGKFAEKNHTIIVPAIIRGKIKGSQGKRTDFDKIAEMLKNGMTPSQIMAENFSYRRYEKYIKDEFKDIRKKQVGPMRDVTVYWHVGESGTGKSYTYKKLCDKYGLDEVYIVTDYERGGFDKYDSQKIIFLDEFKGQMRFSDLLIILDCYTVPIKARYTNALALWEEVHITSVFPPEDLYKDMVQKSDQDIDNIQQLLRRIHYIIYHYKYNNEYKEIKIDIANYTNFKNLKNQVPETDFKLIKIHDTDEIPF